MVAEFYVVPESFAFNSNYSIEEIEKKIRSLSNDIQYIRQYKDSNRFFIHDDIYDVAFLNEISLAQLLSDATFAKTHLKRDTFNALQNIILKSAKTKITAKEVIEELLSEHDENICHGLIAFHQVEGVHPEFQVVYTVNNWLTFRRHFLGMYPKHPDFFITECAKYFPNIFFHERNKSTIGSILKECPKKIIDHLVALNDLFRLSQQRQLNRTEVLNHFSISASLDEKATLEGDAARKGRLTFKFINRLNVEEEVCCEPHLKLCYNDGYPGDRSYSNDRRIYFHEGNPRIAGGKILIGHIGNHL